MRSRRFGRELLGLSIAVDGYDWEECIFRDCEIILSEGNLSMLNCSFHNCHLTLQGPAEAIGRIIALFMQGKPLKFLEKER